MQTRAKIIVKGEVQKAGYRELEFYQFPLKESGNYRFNDEQESR